MAENKHSTDGIAEDIIRSFVQIAGAELHAKTLLEKRISEMENGIVDMSDSEVAPLQFQKINDLKQELVTLAQLRRDDMLFLFELYGSKGDKEKWCTVKHLAMAMYTAFEAWQASDNNERLLEGALAKNKLFIKAVTAFLGVEITECAACFGDILKGELSNE